MKRKKRGSRGLKGAMHAMVRGDKYQYNTIEHIIITNADNTITREEVIEWLEAEMNLRELLREMSEEM